MVEMLVHKHGLGSETLSLFVDSALITFWSRSIQTSPVASWIHQYSL